MLINVVIISILFFNHSYLGELENKPLLSLSISLYFSIQVTPIYDKLLSSYVIEITTGSRVSYKFQYFNPLKIVIPIETGVV
ncbi:MAG: hypothetical protein AB7F53_06985 [Nitrososphaeraceae archaeon]